MAEESAISWTDATFNPWIGCTKVGPGCDRCYAARDNERRKWVWESQYNPETGDVERVGVWGPGVPRHLTKTWGEPLKWNRNHAAFFAEHGRHRRVFCASLADVFDNEVADAWRTELWKLLRATPNLRWMLVTKRIGNARKMLPPDWGVGYPNVGIMATMVDQEEWDRDIGKLRLVPAAWHGVSVEPMLGPIEIGTATWIDWIITGGESGPGFRNLDMAWPRSMQAQCERHGIAYHHKQNGGVRGKDAGCLIDGVEHKHFPPALAA